MRGHVIYPPSVTWMSRSRLLRDRLLSFANGSDVTHTAYQVPVFFSVLYPYCAEPVYRVYTKGTSVRVRSALSPKLEPISVPEGSSPRLLLCTRYGLQEQAEACPELDRISTQLQQYHCTSKVGVRKPTFRLVWCRGGGRSKFLSVFKSMLKSLSMDLYAGSQ